MKKKRLDCQEAVTHAARRIYRQLGAGFVEQVYRDALAVELRVLRLPYEIERNIEVFYRGEKVGLHRLDFIVDGSLVIELKATAKISEHNFAQSRAYLRTTGLSTALVINFPSPESKAGPEVKQVSSRPRPGSRTGQLERKPKQQNKPLSRTGRLKRKPKQQQKPRQDAQAKAPRKPLSDLVWDDVSRRYVDPDLLQREPGHDESQEQPLDAKS